MQYRSTRDQAAKQMTAPEAILQGLAPDGASLCPSRFPNQTTTWGPSLTPPIKRSPPPFGAGFLTTFRWRASSNCPGGLW